MEAQLSHLFELSILIVDDLSAMRTNLIAILQNLGFKNIAESTDGMLAWNLAIDQAKINKPFDLIFSDINMPVMNGIVLLKNLRGSDAYKKIPIFMVSTENEKAVILKCVLGGATDYIIKPFDPELVKNKLLAKLPKA
jgi:two-component system chemotaxis response regulator CheY